MLRVVAVRAVRSRSRAGHLVDGARRCKLALTVEAALDRHPESAANWAMPALSCASCSRSRRSSVIASFSAASVI